MHHQIYLGLGTNLGDRLASLRAAVRLLPPAVTLAALSPLYETEPVGIIEQPPFLNAVCAAGTDLDPQALLTYLKRIEWQLGRRPGPIWGPRPIDIDILLYDDQQIETAELRVPHTRMSERAFVLVPLAALAPDLIVPGTGTTARQLRERVGDAGIRRLADAGWIDETHP